MEDLVNIFNNKDAFKCSNYTFNYNLELISKEKNKTKRQLKKEQVKKYLTSAFYLSKEQQKILDEL